MKICAMSDLHGYLPEVEPCELLLICGDTVPLEHQGSSRSTYKWYSTIFKEWGLSIPCNKIIFIAGNHELHLPNHYNDYKQLFHNDYKITYLCNEEYIYTSKSGKKYTIFGTPYCQIFGNWAFMANSETLLSKYEKIPELCDILITHDQPFGFGDILLQKDCYFADGSNIGNKDLLYAILKKKPYLQLNGHLHSCDHSEIDIFGTKHYNVSLKDEHYNVVYKPLYLNI